MLDFFLQLDNNIVVAINNANSDFLDFIMWHISGKFQWLPLYILMTWLLWKKFGSRKTAVLLVMVAILLILADQICDSVIRPLFERMRPTNPDNPVSSMIHLVNGRTGGKYGFPSCHAANSMAVVVFISLLLNNRKTLWLLLWPLCVAYSRMYMGMHYLSDIIAGWTVGSFLAFGMYLLFKNFSKPAPRPSIIEIDTTLE